MTARTSAARAAAALWQLCLAPYLCEAYDSLHLIDLEKVVCTKGGFFDVQLSTTELIAHRFAPHVVTFLRSSPKSTGVSFQLLDGQGKPLNGGLHTAVLVGLHSRRLEEDEATASNISFARFSTASELEEEDELENSEKHEEDLGEPDARLDELPHDGPGAELHDPRGLLSLSRRRSGSPRRRSGGASGGGGGGGGGGLSDWFSPRRRTAPAPAPAFSPTLHVPAPAPVHVPAPAPVHVPAPSPAPAPSPVAAPPKTPANSAGGAPSAALPSASSGAAATGAGAGGAPSSPAGGGLAPPAVPMGSGRRRAGPGGVPETPVTTPPLAAAAAASSRLGTDAPAFAADSGRRRGAPPGLALQPAKGFVPPGVAASHGTYYTSTGAGYGYSSASALQHSYGGSWPAATPSYGYSGLSSYGPTRLTSTAKVGVALAAGGLAGMGAYYLYNQLYGATCPGYECCTGCPHSCYADGNLACDMTISRDLYRDDILMGTGFIPDDVVLPVTLRILEVAGVDYRRSGICPGLGAAQPADLFATLSSLDEVGSAATVKAAWQKWAVPESDASGGAAPRASGPEPPTGAHVWKVALLAAAAAGVAMLACRVHLRRLSPTGHLLLHVGEDEPTPQDPSVSARSFSRLRRAAAE